MCWQPWKIPVLRSEYCTGSLEEIPRDLIRSIVEQRFQRGNGDVVIAISIDEAPDRRYLALKIFANHLKVAPVTGTRLIDISYTDPDPRLAADVVNRLVQALMDYSFQARFTATARGPDSCGSPSSVTSVPPPVPLDR